MAAGDTYILVVDIGIMLPLKIMSEIEPEPDTSSEIPLVDAGHKIVLPEAIKTSHGTDVSMSIPSERVETLLLVTFTFDVFPASPALMKFVVSLDRL